MEDKKCNRCDNSLKNNPSFQRYFDLYCKDCVVYPNPTFLLTFVYILEVFHGKWVISNWILSTLFCFIMLLMSVTKISKIFPINLIIVLSIVYVLWGWFFFSIFWFKKYIIWQFNLKIKKKLI